MNFHKLINCGAVGAQRALKNMKAPSAAGRGDCPQSPALCVHRAWRAVEGNSPYQSLATVLIFFALLFAVEPDAFAQELSPLAKPPDWTRLEIFQETITHDDFAKLLNDVYAPGDVWKSTIVILDDKALIAEDDAWSKMFTLRFAKVDADGKVKGKPAPHYWKEISKLPPAPELDELMAFLVAPGRGILPSLRNLRIRSNADEYNED